MMAFSGLKETGGTNTAVEFYTIGAGWSQEYPASWTPPHVPTLAPSAEWHSVRLWSADDL